MTSPRLTAVALVILVGAGTPLASCGSMKYRRALHDDNRTFERYADELWERYHSRPASVSVDEAMKEQMAAFDILFAASLADLGATVEAWRYGEPVPAHTLDDAMDRIRFEGLLDWSDAAPPTTVTITPI